jgi:hypothetical protein
LHGAYRASAKYCTVLVLLCKQIMILYKNIRWDSLTNSSNWGILCFTETTYIFIKEEDA